MYGKIVGEQRRADEGRRVGDVEREMAADDGALHVGIVGGAPRLLFARFEAALRGVP